MKPPPPDTCANCGAAIPPTARACPDCGADERTGWREVSPYDGLDLPDENEQGGATRDGVPWYWWTVGMALLLLLALTVLKLR